MTDHTLHYLGHQAANCDDFSRFPDAELKEFKELLVRDTSFFNKICGGEYTRIAVGHFMELPDGNISFFATTLNVGMSNIRMSNIQIIKGCKAAYHVMMDPI